MRTVKQKFLCLGLLIFMTANLFAQQLQSIPIDPNVRVGRLENGLTYIIRHNENPRERAEFFIAQNVGAILENDDQNGLAHFLEHMAFKGTKNFPGNAVDRWLESIGLRLGRNVNAYVSIDETVYILSDVPTTNPNVLDSVLLVLHDWSGFLTLDPEAIEAERGVILEEWRTGMGPERRMWSRANRIRFPDSQYAIRDIIGDTAVINNFEHQTLRDFHDKWHRPDLQAIIVVGDIDVDWIEGRIIEMFSHIPRHENYGYRPIFPIHDNEEPIVAIVTDPEARFTRIEVKFKHNVLPPELRLSEQGFLVNTINSLISTMINNRFQEITMQADAPFVSAFAYYGNLVRSQDAFYFIAIPNEGREMLGLQALLLEAEKVNRYGFTVSEFERAKTDLLRTAENRYNERNNQRNNTLVREYVRHFLDANPIPGIEWEYEWMQRMMPMVNVAMINQVVSMYIPDDGENTIVTIMAPEHDGVNLPTVEQVLAAIEYTRTSDQIVARAEDDMNQPLVERSPRPGRIRNTTHNHAFGTTEWTLSNGVHIIIKPTEFKQDEILMSAFSRGGLAKVRDIADLSSATFATDIVSNNGLGNFTNIEIQRILTGKIANVQPYIQNYEEGFTGNSSVADFETMMQLLYLFFTAPRQDDNAFQAMMNMYRTAFANRARDPRVAFSDSISTIMANRSPRLVIANLETLDRVSQDRALAIFKERFANPADFTFVFTGNIDPNNPEVRRAINTYLGGLRTTRMRESFTDDGIRRPEGRILNYFTREMQVAKVSNFIVYSAEIPFNLQNRVAMEAIGNILFTRYFESVRAEEGGTYGVGVRGSLAQLPISQASLIMQFDTNADAQERLMKIIHAEVQQIANYGPREDDLQNVIVNLLKRYEQDLEENTWWRTAILGKLRSDLNLVQDYRNAVESLTQQSIQALVQEIIRQGNVLEVVMLPEE
jgi:zinc protease